MVLKIEVFGTGCVNCRQLEKNVRDAVGELGLAIEVIKIEDFETLIKRGITMTPGLAIDGEIVAMGRVPSVEDVKGMISER
ncbi:MAG: TM0996/MTH895 family glutaredoxin-like protein [Methanomassiliicoccus sp.]|nr:TM0996/MTH895 family glutaredoxin-like protein [Methanomassiliicoccus sp.]